MHFQRSYNRFLICFCYMLLIAWMAETAVAATIPAEKGYLYKADWRFVRDLVSKMKWYENWPQKQEALRKYATSYEQSKNYSDYRQALENGVRLYSDYDNLARLLGNGDTDLYKLLLANQNAFDNLVNLSISKHKTIENSFKSIKSTLAMAWAIFLFLLSILGINYLRKYHYLNDLHEYLIDHYIKFFATFYVILFAYLTYLLAGPATLGSPRRVYSGLQKTLSKEVTYNYSEGYFFHTIFHEPKYQKHLQYQNKLAKAKNILGYYENGDSAPDTSSMTTPLNDNMLDLDAEITAHGRIHKAHHEIESLYEKQNLENYYAVHPERKPKKKQPPSTPTLQTAPRLKKPSQPAIPSNHHIRKPIPQKPLNQFRNNNNQRRPGNASTRPAPSQNQFNKKIIDSILKDLPVQENGNLDASD